jgi:hypothetical protein
MITTDIVVKTYPADYDWLPYLFRSIDKFVTGYRRIVLIIEEQFPDPEDLPYGAVVCRSRRYVGTDVPSDSGAVIERLRPFEYSDAERSLFVDSDCVFTRKIDLQTDPSIVLDRPVLYWRTWEEGAFAIRWKEPSRQVLGYEPKYETMCRYPFTYPSDVLASFWQHVGGEKRLARLPSITDWNSLGNFAIDFHHGLMTPRHWSTADEPCVRQFWSHHRANHPDVQAELKGFGLL